MREVTRPTDNKADPNLETRTYGLFSTCERGMRAGIVRDGRPHVFFVTSRHGVRVLAGYYRLGWYARAKPMPAAWNGCRFLDDFCLAAEEAHFIHPAPPLAEVATLLGDPALARRFRLCKRISAATVSGLLNLLNERPNAIDAYIGEVQRLERVNQRFTGYRYVNWRESGSFSWVKAADFLSDEGTALALEKAGKLQGSGAKKWKCVACASTTDSNSPLRRCAHCKAVGTQIPDV